MSRTSAKVRSRHSYLPCLPMRVLLAVQLVVLLLLVRIAPTSAQQPQCTVCADGTTTPMGSLGTTDCSLIADSIAMTPDTDPECGMIRLQGFLHCACPTLPTDQYCSLCDYSSSSGTASYQSLPTEYRSWTIPTLDNIECEDAEFLSAGHELCGSTALMEAAWFCGCGTGDSVQRGQCYLCGDDTTTTPNTRSLPPPLDTKTCEQLDREGGLYYNVVDGGDTCESLLLGDTFPSQFDYQSYCGCVENAEVPNVCSLCGVDSSVQNPDGSLGGSSTMTCAELEMATPYVLDTDYCTELQDQYADRCCNPAPPPTATSPAPSATPAADGENSGGGDDNNENPAPVPAPVSPPTPIASSGGAVARMTWTLGVWIPIVLHYYGMDVL